MIFLVNIESVSHQRSIMLAARKCTVFGRSAQLRTAPLSYRTPNRKRTAQSAIARVRTDAMGQLHRRSPGSSTSTTTQGVSSSDRLLAAASAYRFGPASDLGILSLITV